MSQKWCVQKHVEDEFMCNICQTLMTNPYRPRSCKHSFCKGCLTKVQDRLCPVCRRPFGPQDIIPDDRLRNTIQSMKYQCDTCRDQFKVTDYETHSMYCSSDSASYSSRSLQSAPSVRTVRSGLVTTSKGGAGPGAGAYGGAYAGASGGAGATVMTTSRSSASIAGAQRGYAAANRYTFTCPYCHAANLDSNDLIEHCNADHKDDEKNMVCPICVSMPWGNPNQHSVDFITHLNVRHRFDYDKFVSFDLTDQEQLAEALRTSLRVF